MILIPIILEKIDVPLSQFFTSPQKSFPKLFNNVWIFYKDLIGNGFDLLGKWISSYFGNIVDENIKGKKIEIQLK